MKFVQIFLIVVLLSFSLSACVTTRSELNEKRGLLSGDSSEEASPRSSVKSEDLNEPAVVAVPAGSQYGMEELRAEVAKLTGKIEELEHEKKTQETERLEEKNKLQAKIDELEKQLKEKEEQENGPKLPAGKTALQAAKDAYQNSNYELAIQYLDPFLKNNESGKEVEEATFVRGESNFKLKQYKKAIVDYSKFTENFPKSNFSSKALLKIAESFEALEMKEDAKAFYQDLFDKYPKTVEGKLAKKKLSGKSSKK